MTQQPLRHCPYCGCWTRRIGRHIGKHHSFESYSHGSNVPPPKRGRPPKLIIERRQDMESLAKVLVEVKAR